MENHTHGELLRQSPLDSRSIDYGQFTVTLMQEAARKGLLGAGDVVRIQRQLLDLLSEQIQKFTRGESSSIPAETADELMDGIGYCIDIALQIQPTLEESAALLQSRTAHELYALGRDYLAGRVRASEALLARIRSTRTPTVNAAYNITIDNSAPMMLRLWKADPYPRDFAVILEYPTAVESSLDGIPGLYARLSALALENRFCAKFPAETRLLLQDYAHQNRVSPADAYVNLFAVVMRNLLFSILLEQESLTLLPDDVERLRTQLVPLAADERKLLILQAAQAALKRCAFAYPKLESYITEFASLFAAELNAANGEPAPFAVISQESTSLISTLGDRLEDDAFTMVVDEILLCETAAEKAQIIENEIRSLDDLTDALGAFCIFDDEFAELFAAFDDSVCALLLHVTPCDIVGSKVVVQNDGVDWQVHLASYLNSLNTAHLGNILVILHSLDG